MAEAAYEAAAVPEGVEATAVVEQPEPPSFEADTSGIEDLLAQPDDDEEVVYTEPDYVAPAPDEYEDPAVAQLKTRLAKAEARLKHEESLRVQNQSKAWREEGKRRFPFADVEEIQATSRRSFLKQAQAQHERVERKVSPFLAELEKLREQVVTEAKTEGRETAERAWGIPQVGPQAGTVTASEAQASLDRRQYKNPLEMIKARLANDPQFTDGV
ncbi:MAG: hypothetical protein ACYC9L_05505 [Sulfuricaulis sp.]